MPKRVFIMRKVQRATTGENILLEREVESTFTEGNGNLGVEFAHYKDDFASSFGYDVCQDIWDSLAEVDGHPSTEYIRVTLNIEKVTQEEIDHAL